MTISLIENAKFQAECRNHKVVLDQPVEDGGSDGGMTPVELFIASFGACIGYFACVFLQRRKIPADGLTVDLDWSSADNPHRVDSIEARIKLPAKLLEKEKAGLLRTVKGCTIHNTLHVKPELKILLT